MCNGIRDAIDNTRASLAGYPTHNSWATRFWDEINNYLIKHIMVLMGVENCEVFITNRGPWLLGMAYSNGIVYSFMREKRFAQLKDEYKRNTRMTHYTVSLSRVLNIDLQINEQSLFANDTSNTMERSKDVVHKILQQLIDQDKVINGYVLILFDADEINLYSARMVLLNGSLAICDCRDLNNYIKFHEPVITESVNDYPNNTPADPYNRLNISAKAHKRLADKKKKELEKVATEENENTK